MQGSLEHFVDTAISADEAEPETEQELRSPPDPELGALPGETWGSVPSDTPLNEHEHPTTADTACRECLATKVRGSLCSSAQPSEGSCAGACPPCNAPVSFPRWTHNPLAPTQGSLRRFVETAIAAFKAEPIKTEPELKQTFRPPPDHENDALPRESWGSVPSDVPLNEHAAIATKVRGSLCSSAQPSEGSCAGACPPCNAPVSFPRWTHNPLAPTQGSLRRFMDTAIAAIATEPETKQSFRLPPDPERGALPRESWGSVRSDVPLNGHAAAAGKAEGAREGSLWRHTWPTLLNMLLATCAILWEVSF
jgi:hypothetical protein